MSPKETAKKTIAGKTKTMATHKNGSQTPDEHLAKANKAMTKAWNLISRRKDKSD